MKERLPELDWMRGIVMVLMVTDHASEAFNGNRAVADSALIPGWDQPLDTAQFFFRWLSHLCAPVFVFLAGTSLAISIARRTKSGVSQASIDLDLLIRGLIIIGMDYSFIDWLWTPGMLLFQVMFAIGTSFLLMIVLRRLPAGLLLGLGVALLVASEFLRAPQLGQLSTPENIIRAVTFSGGWFADIGYSLSEFSERPLMVAYPALPWCAIMMFGWVLAQKLLLQPRDDSSKRYVQLGSLCFVVFLVLRGINHEFGNLGLVRLDNSFAQWMHVSKYPPSLSFVGLELGLMFAILAGLRLVRSRLQREPSEWNPLLVFGQTAFFFYLVHVYLLAKAPAWLEQEEKGGITEAVLGTVVIVVLLYPVCIVYRAVKKNYPRSVLRYF